MNQSQAQAVRFDHYGDVDVLYLADIPMPTPSTGEVLVEIRAAGINPGETNVRTGALHTRFPATFPSGQGSDLAGIVTALGDDVRDFTVGDEVLGYSWQRSSHATHTVVPTTQLISKPPQLSWEVAGSLYVVGCTAYAAVRAIDPQPGETVAVSAAAGGVGSIVVQLLALRGIHILGIASPINDTWLTEHGGSPIHYGDGLADRLTAAAPKGSMPSLTCTAPNTSSSLPTSVSGATESKPSSPSTKHRNWAPKHRAAPTPPAGTYSRRLPASSRASGSSYRSQRPTHSATSSTRSANSNDVIPMAKSCSFPSPSFPGLS